MSLHVALAGSGALARVYGVRLCVGAGTTVSFVVRSDRSIDRMRIARIDGDRAVSEIVSPRCVATVPTDADVILVAVRAEQLESATPVLESGPDVPVILLTPQLPAEYDRLLRRLGERVRAAMPGVVAYVNPEGICRYWLPRVAPTLVDERPPVPTAVLGLVSALGQAGLPSRLEPNVATTNPATTVAVMPIFLGLDIAGSVDGLLKDRDLLALALEGVDEGTRLAALIGKTPPWIDLFTRFAGPRMIKIGVGLARSRSPEALAYVEEHFGRKLHAQNLAMAGGLVALAKEKGARAKALEALLARLRAAE